MTVHTTDAQQLAAFLEGRRTLVLSGAGLSTDSGIPDYRGRGRSPRSPMRYQEFTRDPRARQRYWSRSVIGWPLTDGAAPNEAHRALARMERRGVILATLTQNVDGLHQQAGSRAVLELHGSLGSVVCLGCGVRSRRSEMQRRLLDANPYVAAAHDVLAPDGDVDVDDDTSASFVVPACVRCGGVLKPDVTFFGENVPAGRVERAWSWWSKADALLVVGSSLTVFSGYRFVKRARERGMPIAIVNDGATRGDADATWRSHARLGTILPAVCSALAPSRSDGADASGPRLDVASTA